MQINVPKAMVGLGTTGIGDNFARTRLLMAKQAGYVQSTPSPYAQPGTALKQYQSIAPMLNQVAQQQNVKGIPGLLRQGMMQAKFAPPPVQSAPIANFNSQMAGHAAGNPFAALGQPQMALNWFNRPGGV